MVIGTNYIFFLILGTVVRYGTHNLVEKVAQVLGERLYDSSPAVRKEVVTIAGDWLVNLPDRYSQFCRIIPLVVPGCVPVNFLQFEIFINKLNSILIGLMMKCLMFEKQLNSSGIELGSNMSLKMKLS